MKFENNVMLTLAVNWLIKFHETKKWFLDRDAFTKIQNVIKVHFF